ncbi:hypothetical protein ACX80V_21710 [Arthrobacter sp. MDT3-24]
MGHSLGGLIVRHAVVEESDEWIKTGRLRRDHFFWSTLMSGAYAAQDFW